MLVGADDVHLDFARGIAAQPRAVLHQDDLGAVPRRGDGRADAGQSAAGDEHVGIQHDLAHVGLRGSVAGVGRSDALEIKAASAPGHRPASTISEYVPNPARSKNSRRFTGTIV